MHDSKEIDAIVEKASQDRDFRLELVEKSFFWFIHIYFPNYLSYPMAEFHKEMIGIMEKESNTVVFTAFRGSGKSTIVSLAYVVWAMTGTKNKRFIILLSHTEKQAETLMYSIKQTLEENELLKNDLGPFQETAGEWKISSLIFKNYDARIMAGSVNESIRGLRYKEKRPDLIICDDVETLETVNTEEGKEKTIIWYDRVITPLGDEGTSIVVLGTIMSTGALILTLKERIQQGLLNGVFRKYPIVDDNNNPLWSSRWADYQAMEGFRKNKGIVELTWQTEYLLNEWVNEDQVIKLEDIHYYEQLPINIDDFRETLIGVDLAFSEKQTADYTAIVQGEFYGSGKDAYLYILPKPVNRRISYPHTRELLSELSHTKTREGKSPNLVVEEVATQKGIVQDLEASYLPVTPFNPGTQDKYSRLWGVSAQITTGKVLFPREGAENLIKQLTNFGVVKQHDDLVDALVMIIDYMAKRSHRCRTFGRDSEIYRLFHNCP